LLRILDGIHVNPKALTSGTKEEGKDYTMSGNFRASIEVATMEILYIHKCQDLR